MFFYFTLCVLKIFAEQDCVFHYHKADIYLNDVDLENLNLDFLKDLKLYEVAEEVNGGIKGDVPTISPKAVEIPISTDEKISFFGRCKSAVSSFFSSFKPKSRSERIREEILYLLEILINENNWHDTALQTIDEVLNKVNESDVPGKYVLELFRNFIDEYDFEGKEEVLKFIEKLAINVSKKYGKVEMIEAIRAGLFEIYKNRGEDSIEKRIGNDYSDEEISAKSCKKGCGVKKRFRRAESRFSALS